MYNDAEQQEKKKQKAEERKKKKWEESEYESRSISLMPAAPVDEKGSLLFWLLCSYGILDEMGYISDFSESEEEKDICYLTGDATKPKKKKGPCIIIKYVLY